jgi:hypothetical protein
MNFAKVGGGGAINVEDTSNYFSSPYCNFNNNFALNGGALQILTQSRYLNC